MQMIRNKGYEMASIYFDHSATTPLHPDVLQAMSDSMHQVFGNASSIHAFGREARLVLNRARDNIAAQLGCLPQELVFTSSGTESNNTAIFGIAWSSWLKMLSAVTFKHKENCKPHIITSQIEHHAVLHACERLEQLGFAVTYAAPDITGRVSVQSIQNALRPNTCLISIMYGNNEVGTLQPIEEIGRFAHANGVLMHTDAVSALSKVKLQLNDLPLDFASFSAHKINGPKGVGLLYARSGINWDPLMYGGSQERKRRAGTENIAGVIGLAKALEIANIALPDKIVEVGGLRNAMWFKLKEALGDRVIMNGNPSARLPHILNVSFLDVPLETMLMSLDLAGIMASSGSACTSGSLGLSHVLQAMGIPDECKRTAVRFSFGLGNTMEEAVYTVQQIVTIVSRIRTR